MELHAITHILLGAAMIVLAMFMVWDAARTIKAFRAESQALQALLTALKSQAALLNAIVKHLENDAISELLELHNAEEGTKH